MHSSKSGRPSSMAGRPRDPCHRRCERRRHLTANHPSFAIFRSSPNPFRPGRTSRWLPRMSPASTQHRTESARYRRRCVSDGEQNEIALHTDWEIVAWRRIADPLVATFERREIRNHVRVCHEELRRCLAIKSNRLHFRVCDADDVPRQPSRAKVSAFCLDEFAFIWLGRKRNDDRRQIRFNAPATLRK